MLKSSVGIKAFDAYLPPIEINQSEIVALAQGSRDTALSLGIEHKRLPQPSDDTLTLGVETVSNLQKRYPASQIGALYLGSETPVYAVGNTAAAIAHFCNIEGNDLKTADMEFACRAGTLAMIAAIGHVRSFDSDAIAVSADIAKGAPGDVLAMTTGAGSSSFCITEDLENSIAHITNVYSFTHRRSDFWRSQNEEFPRHAGRYSNAMYEETITKAIENFFQQNKRKISDFDHIILHQPNGKLPLSLAEKLGITSEQISLGFCFPKTGNLYAAMVPFSLARVLSKAKPGQRILVASYGSGAGSDVLEIQTTEKITAYQSKNPFNISTINNSEA